MTVPYRLMPRSCPTCLLSERLSGTTGLHGRLAELDEAVENAHQVDGFAVAQCLDDGGRDVPWQMWVHI